MKYVQDVEPQVMEQFAEQSPPQVVGAMKQTITNLLGTLPPQFFTVRVQSAGENLAQLMYSVMMTGYMFRNTQYRLELKNTLGTFPPTPATPSQQPATPSSTQLPAPINPSDLAPAPSTVTSLTTANSETRLLASTSSIDLADSRSSMDAPATSYSSSGGNSSSRSRGGGSMSSTSSSSSLDSTSMDDEEYAPGVQKTRVKGEVLRWHYKNGLEELPAVEYIDMLEAEVASLRQQLATLAAGPPRPPPRQYLDENHNELLEYLKTLDSHSLQELTAGAGDEVAEAMNTFIHRMLGTKDNDQLRATASDCTANELAKLLFWLMVVGYSLRTLEVRFDMELSLDIPPTDFGGSSKGLPPGR